MSEFETKHRWGFMQRTTLHDVNTGKNYLARLRIIETPWFAIFLHRLGEPDPGADLHDHPWYFKSLILYGGYDEEHAQTRDIDGTMKVRRWTAGSTHALRLDEAHRISFLHAIPTWSLLLVGRRVRHWGFYTDDGFVHHSDYDNGLRNLEKKK